MPQEEIREGGKVSIDSENPSRARTGESFRTSERNGETSAWKAKLERIHYKRSLLTNTSQPRNCLHCLCGEWGLGAEAQA